MILLKSITVTMQETINHLQKFRKDLYNCFPKRRDAIMNLLDAISSYGHVSNSIVQLSKADSFERQYSSITDAIGTFFVTGLS